MSFRQIEGVEPLYILPDPRFTSDVLNPYVAAAMACDCMIGFFSSSALRELAPGLAEFLAKPFARMRLTVCPFLTTADREALEIGGSQAAEVLLRALEAEYGKAVVDATALTKHTLRCLSYLVAAERLTIKIVTVSGGLFHPKVWLLYDGDDIVAIHGSNNLTRSALVNNVEQVYVTTSWGAPEARQVTEKLVAYFESLWSEPVSERLRVYAFPEALKARILRDYPAPTAPTPEDFSTAIREEEAVANPGPAGIGRRDGQVRQTFEIPAHLVYETGTYAYQGEAVRAWEAAGCQGILEMATGSGKTITSLIAARRAFDRSPQGLLLIIAAPYLPLISQWRREAEAFGAPVQVPGDAADKAAKLQIVSQAVRSLNYRASSFECLVVTHDFLRQDTFKSELAKSKSANMLIADEVHNLGTSSFLGSTPNSFQLRLGLSATPVRQYDAEGTAGLFAYFGDVVYRFTLKDAIGRCLVPYDYYVHPVPLTTDEFEQWTELSRKLAENSWRSGDQPAQTSRVDPYIQVLLTERRRIVEQAESKLEVFRSVMRKEDLPNLRHALVYASDKGRDQLRSVNRILMDDLGLKIHQVTQQETSTGCLAEGILSNFATGSGLQILTAMRVLDEGVDIPEVDKTYFLASSTVERQWIQRRGRVLRKCARTNKQKATIHDFLVVPPQTGLSSDRFASVSLLRGELKRALEFCGLAANAGQPDGAMSTLTQLSDRYL